jgi:hypothetical protein
MLQGVLGDTQGVGGSGGDVGPAGLGMAPGVSQGFTPGGAAAGGQAGEYMSMMMAGGMEGQQPPAKVRGTIGCEGDSTPMSWVTSTSNET